MKNILILNGKKDFGHSRGSLNQHLSDVAEIYIRELGHIVDTTLIDNGYDIDAEISKWLKADIIIYQMAGWWMGTPWIVKKYIDEVLTQGHGKLYSSDGRTRSDNTKKYGSGGLLHDKKYMLSLTWNAPLEAFTDPKQFFNGIGVDGVYFAFHKAQEFIGMSALPTFLCNDVMKEPDVENDVLRYKIHLKKIFV